METIGDTPFSKTDFGLVSIIMPNYNSETFIESSIQSVLAQSYKNWELLFVDDCSTDRSVEKAKAFDDSRIKIFLKEKNEGAASARNFAIEKASGRWIAFLDSDDSWSPDKLQKQIEFMISKNVAFSFTDYKVVTKSGNVLFYKSPKNICTYSDILKHNHIGCLTVVYDVERLGKLYMPENAVKREDLACWLSILKKDVNAVCLHEFLAEYVIHSHSVSSNKTKMIKYQWNVYRNVEKLPFFKSLYCMACWAISGLKKYR